MPTSGDPRVEVIRAPDRLVLRFRAPAGPRIALAIFFLSFLTAWLAGTVAVFSMFGDGRVEGRAATLAGMWLVVWFAGGGVGVWGLWRSVLSHEVVEATAEGLALRRVLGPLATASRFEARRVKHLRHEPARRGAFAFEYGGSTVLFGPGTPAAEAGPALAALQEILPKN
jgi:hypothetical protein